MKHVRASGPLRRFNGLVWALASLVSLGEDWPQWRGPDRSNASSEKGLLRRWPADGPPLVWRATGIGLGIHSVSVAGGRVFVVGNRDGGEFVFALDTHTGEKLWAHRIGDSIEEHPRMRWLTQRSPTVDGERLYWVTMGGELVCLRTDDGRKVWRRNYPMDFGADRPMWGFCDHPLVDGSRLICSPGSASAALAALDKHTGVVLWTSTIDPRSTERRGVGYAALMRSAAGGIPQFVHSNGTGLTAFAADDGRQLWRYARRQTRVAPSLTPVVLGDRILSPSGYAGGLAVFDVVRGVAGLEVREVAHWPMMLDAFQDCAVHDADRLYLLVGGTPLCVDINTGVPLWGTNSMDRRPSAAFTWADGHLYLRALDNAVVLLEVANDGTTERGRFHIPDHEPSLGVTSPVVANGRLWLRDNNRLFCYDVSAGVLDANPPRAREIAIGLSDGELGVVPDTPRPPRTGVHRAPDAVFVPTPHDIVERMLQEAGVLKSDVLVDLGSGDGRYVITAAKRFGCQAIGYEIDARLVAQSRESIARENLQSLARIEHADLFTADWSDASVVTVFLYPRLMERLLPQFDRLRPGTRIVSHQFEIPGVAPDREIQVKSVEDGDTHRIFFWTTPLMRSPSAPSTPAPPPTKSQRPEAE